MTKGRTKDIEFRKQLRLGLGRKIKTYTEEDWEEYVGSKVGSGRLGEKGEERRQKNFT